MEGQELAEGKQRVRDLLITPLVNMGMARKRGVSKDSEELMFQSLEARLAYMTADTLPVLVDVVARHGGGKSKDTWPSEISICNWARSIQEPMGSESRLVRSYLQSAAGSAAVSGGYVVELFTHLKKFGAPPNSYTLSQIKLTADQNQARIVRIKRDREHGRALPSDLSWLEQYYQTMKRCEDIVAAKQPQKEVV